jgi:hypothetical protein
LRGSGYDSSKAEDHSAKLEIVLHQGQALENGLEDLDGLVQLLIQDLEGEDRVVPESHC